MGRVLTSSGRLVKIATDVMDIALQETNEANYKYVEKSDQIDVIHVRMPLASEDLL